MSSAGSESPLSNPLPEKPDADVVLEKLCKKGTTVTRASEFLNELAKHSPGEFPNGMTSLCAFIASEQLENRDVSVGLARTSSGLSWDQFWHCLSNIQDLLVNAAALSSQFKYTRLPSYVPPCDTCEHKNFDCVKKIAPSTKCQVCSIRKKVCTRQDNAHERQRKSEEAKTAHDEDSWLSDLDSEPERSKDVVQVKKSRSPSPSTQLESLLNDIDETKQPTKTLPSPTLSPKWTTLEDGVRGSPVQHQQNSHQRLNAGNASSLKRKLASSSEPNGKKRRTDDPVPPSRKSPSKVPDRLSPHVPRPTVLQRASAPQANGSHPGMSPPIPRKQPRPPSPISSETGQRSTHNLPSTSARRTRPDDSRLLRDALQKKAREIVTHVEAQGCKGIGLRLHILDMKTRLVEFDKINAEPVPSKSSLDALEKMLIRAAEAVVASLQSDGCLDVGLRLMVLDLNTRLTEMDKER